MGLSLCPSNFFAEHFDDNESAALHSYPGRSLSLSDLRFPRIALTWTVISGVVFGQVIRRYQKKKEKPKKKKKKKKKKGGGKSAMAYVIIVILGITLYVLGVVPIYRAASDGTRLVILVLFHPLFKAGLMYIVRDGILQKTTPARYDCAALFAVEAIWGLIGRFFVTFSARAIDSALLGVVAVSSQEFFTRAYRVDIVRFSRWVRGKPPMTDAQFARFKAVTAVEERQEMSIEMACIIVATVYELFFWDVRWIIDLGSPTTADRIPLQKTLMLLAIQIVCMAVVDVVSQHSMLKQNIPMLSVWKGRSRIWIFREMFQFMMASATLLLAMHVVPLVVFCTSADDVCECSFTMSLPAVAEHCGLGSIAKVVEGDDLDAALAWCARSDACPANNNN